MPVIGQHRNKCGNVGGFGIKVPHDDLMSVFGSHAFLVYGVDDAVRGGQCLEWDDGGVTRYGNWSRQGRG